jgi:formate hydrogenlyase subunit 3/multisubunit Na+/H+ antiporter MnhD subunit
MTKVAVYGFIRIVFELLGEPQWWSGLLVLLAGGATSVLGVLYALMQHDLKRLLAYHTVENIASSSSGSASRSPSTPMACRRRPRSR